MATITPSGIVAEPRTVRVGSCSITESEPGVLAFSGLTMSVDTSEDLATLLTVWKYGLVDGGGHELSDAETIAARAWLVEHQGK